MVVLNAMQELLEIWFYSLAVQCCLLVVGMVVMEDIDVLFPWHTRCGETWMACSSVDRGQDAYDHLIILLTLMPFPFIMQGFDNEQRCGNLPFWSIESSNLLLPSTSPGDTLITLRKKDERKKRSASGMNKQEKKAV